MDKFRLLMVSHMHFGDDAGGPRVNNTLASEFRRLGHTVDTFGIEDALPGSRSRLVSVFAAAMFRRRAIRYVQRHAHKYDIIQAEQGNLPLSKDRLGLTGLLVAQSNGLAHFYDEFEKRQRSMKYHPRRGTLGGDVLRRIASEYNHPIRTIEKSFEHADLIVVINDEEADHVSNVLGYNNKAFCRPNGLSDDYLLAFSGTRSPRSSRLDRPQAAFIGNWTPRKGADDWPKIVRRVRSHTPRFRFLLLGTMVAADSVLNEFDEEDRASVTVVPKFHPSQLPDFLADATVGILPSYIEGFPLAVLEMLAAGLPVVAYDNPGNRNILRRLENSLLVPTGQPEVLGDRVVQVLSCESEYLRLAEEAIEVASAYRWKDIAERTFEEYLRRLALVRSARGLT